MVEMALVVPVLLVFLLGAVDFAQVLSVQQRLEQAAHLAAVRMLKDPGLRTSAALDAYIQSVSGLAPIDAASTYTTGADLTDQVVVTAAYSYTLLMPGLRNLQVGAITDGKLHLNVSAAGSALTTAPAMTPMGSSSLASTPAITVSVPNNRSVPANLALSCTLTYSGTVVAVNASCGPTSPLTYTVPATGTGAYSATLTQANGLVSPPVTVTLN